MNAQRIWRARPSLGTVVKIQLHTSEPERAHTAIEEAFEVIEKIQTLMSAHHASSDLGRLSRAQTGETLRIHPWTHEVIGLAQHWFHQSGGAFDPCKAARQLRRPGLAPHADGDFSDVVFLPDAKVLIQQPVMLDLGGIAKGYAVDKAVEQLQQSGMHDGVVDAGGDIRAWGDGHTSCEVRHARAKLRDQRMTQRLRLHNQAVATSVAAPINPEFVKSLNKRHTWRSATVLAPDCVTADALTKWALQSSLLCPELGKILRQYKAKMWRSE